MKVGEGQVINKLTTASMLRDDESWNPENPRCCRFPIISLFASEKLHSRKFSGMDVALCIWNRRSFLIHRLNKGIELFLMNFSPYLLLPVSKVFKQLQGCCPCRDWNLHTESFICPPTPRPPEFSFWGLWRSLSSPFIVGSVKCADPGSVWFLKC